jgi:cbb3-type cytochrome oxidase subunit 3
MDWLTVIRSTVTVLAFGSFLAIVWWAYSAQRKPAFEAAARLALEDDLHPGDGRDAVILTAGSRP